MNSSAMLTFNILLKLSQGFMLTVKFSVSELNSRAIVKVNMSVK